MEYTKFRWALPLVVATELAAGPMEEAYLSSRSDPYTPRVFSEEAYAAPKKRQALPPKTHREPVRNRAKHAPANPKTQDDSPLETRIDAYIQDLRRTRYLAPTDHTSFVVYDIDNQRKLVSINEDDRMMAASTIKVYVMLAYFDQVSRGRIAHTNRNKGLLRRMIQRSDNSATNTLMRRIGGPRAVENILSARYPEFNETDVVEYIPASNGRTYRNTTSAHDLNIFYNQLWLGRLPYADKMKYYLGLPGNDRLFKQTCIPRGMSVFNKTGSVYGLVADGGILVMRNGDGKSHPYAITGMIEDETKTDLRKRRESFGSWKAKRSEVIRSVSEGTYDYLYKKYTGREFSCRQHGGLHLGRRQ